MKEGPGGNDVNNNGGNSGNGKGDNWNHGDGGNNNGPEMKVKTPVT